jgi:hypothetical protein
MAHPGRGRRRARLLVSLATVLLLLSSWLGPVSVALARPATPGPVHARPDAAQMASGSRTTVAGIRSLRNDLKAGGAR